MPRNASLLLLLTCLPLSSAQTVDPEAIEKEALAPRRALKSGIVELTSHYSEFAGGKKTVSGETTYTIWFDGDQIRRDAYRHYQPAQKHQKLAKDAYREVSCFGKDQHYWWTDKVGLNGAAYVLRVDNDPKSITSTLFTITHPNVIGMAPRTFANLVHHNTPDNFIGRADRTPPSMTREATGGVDCWKIEFSLKNGVKARAWIAPDRGYSPIRLETEFTSAGKVYFHELHSDVAPIPGANLWFPRRCECLRRIDGAVVAAETLDVALHDVNKPVPASVFTLAGLDIPPGTHVSFIHFDPPRKMETWDGKKLVP